MKRKRTPLEILRSRERRRAIVPPALTKRRMVLMNAGDRYDPGAARIRKANRMTIKHRKMFESLLMRQMALVNTPAALQKMLDNEGLDHIKLDPSTKSLIDNSIRKVSEVVIFQLVIKELVNDPSLREKMLDLFVQQRFDIMKPRAAQPDKPAKKEDRPDKYQDDPVMRQLAGMLKELVGG